MVPKVAATRSPPTKWSGVRRRMSPIPIPIRISGHSSHAREMVSWAIQPWLTASGIAPRISRKIPRLARRRSIDMPERPSVGRRAYRAGPRCERPNGPPGGGPVVACHRSARGASEQRRSGSTMRLNDWSARAPIRGSVAPKVLAVAESALAALGASPDSECWAIWGDDPAARWMLLAPTPAGLVTAHVRVNVPQEGPRAAAKARPAGAGSRLGRSPSEVEGVTGSSAPPWRASSCAAPTPSADVVWAAFLRGVWRRSTGARCPPPRHLLRSLHRRSGTRPLRRPSRPCCSTSTASSSTRSRGGTPSAWSWPPRRPVWTEADNRALHGTQLARLGRGHAGPPGP